MGKDLHYSILTFLAARLHGHQFVSEVIDISTKDYYIYRIKRTKGMRDVVLVLIDAYHYSEFDYFSKPSALDEGGFILIARPEATFFESWHQYTSDKIVLGSIGVLLGALRKDEFWTYERPKKKDEGSN